MIALFKICTMFYRDVQQKYPDLQYTVIDICDQECDDGCFWGTNANLQECPNCKTDRSSARKLFHFSITAQIARMRQDKILGPLLNLNSRRQSLTYVTDIQESQLWMDLIKKLVRDGGDMSTAVIGLTGDGAPLFKGRKGHNQYTVYLLSCEMVNLPPKHRMAAKNRGPGNPRI